MTEGSNVVMSFIEKQKAVSGDPYSKFNDSIQLKEDPNAYLKQWRKADMKNQLENAIREKMMSGKLPQISINEKMLINEYWAQWLQIDEKEHQTKLLRHPAMKLNDYKGIQNVITNERARQFYWALGLSAGTYAVYYLSLQKKARFYNFFRKQSPYKIVNISKAALGGIALVWTWTLSLTYFFDQKIPTDLAKKGFFRDYQIMFESVYL